MAFTLPSPVWDSELDPDPDPVELTLLDVLKLPVPVELGALGLLVLDGSKLPAPLWEVEVELGPSDFTVLDGSEPASFLGSVVKEGTV